MEELQNLVHDLANKLTIAKMSSLKLKKKYPTDGDIAVLEMAIERSTEILTQLRETFVNNKNHGTVSVESENETTVSLDVLKKVAKMHDLKVAVNVDNLEHTKLSINRKQMLSIIDNIFENAKKASATIVKITGKSTHDSLVFTFTDNGKGSDNIQKIGTGFTTGGTGRGTKIIKEYIHSAGGSSSWISNSYGGVSVIISLKKILPKVA